MIDDPIYHDVPRSLVQRLFTLPWRPFLKTRRVRDLMAEYDRRMAFLDSEKRQRAWINTDPWSAHVAALQAPPVSRFAAESAARRYARPSPAPAPEGSIAYDPSLDYLALAGGYVGQSAPTPPAPAPFESGGGGDFAGGGASGRWGSDTPMFAKSGDTDNKLDSSVFIAPAPAYEAPAPSPSFESSSSSYDSGSSSSSFDSGSGSFDSGSSS